jgi:CubicO group peptidase (beta-lactamase class C family)
MAITPFNEERRSKKNKLHVLFLSAVLGLTLAMPAMPQGQTPTAETPFDRVMEIQDFFKNPDNLVKIQFPGSETLYAWQHMSQFYPTARVARAGNISTLETKINDAIGDVKFKGADGKTRKVIRHFETRPMDAMIVVRQGKIVYERYKTMTPETTHNWFSSGKVISATLLAMLESEGKVDLSKPLPHELGRLGFAHRNRYAIPQLGLRLL